MKPLIIYLSLLLAGYFFLPAAAAPVTVEPTTSVSADSEESYINCSAVNLNETLNETLKEALNDTLDGGQHGFMWGAEIFRKAIGGGGGKGGGGGGSRGGGGGGSKGGGGRGIGGGKSIRIYIGGRFTRVSANQKNPCEEDDMTTFFIVMGVCGSLMLMGGICKCVDKLRASKDSEKSLDKKWENDLSENDKRQLQKFENISFEEFLEFSKKNANTVLENPVSPDK